LHRSLLEKGEIKPMDTESLLKDKIVLAVDDEVDVTDTIVEGKPMIMRPPVSF
jgi:hypothetical protein